MTSDKKRKLNEKKDDAAALIHFIDRSMDMKLLKRQGWQRYANQSESLAEHSFGSAILALLLVDRESQLDELAFSRERVVLLTLLHDLPETMFLDIDRSLHELLGEERACLIKDEIDTKSIESLENLLPEGHTYTRSLINQLVASVSESKELKIIRAADLLDLFFRARWLFSRNLFPAGDVLRSFTVDILEELKEIGLESVNELVSTLEKERWLEKMAD
ncbi:MAG: HD domain-containing protein [Candidatus Odinarchaeota archaeon]